METLIIILKILGGGLARRVAGGMGNKLARNYSGKPKGWEIENNYIRVAWALYFTLLIFGSTPSVWELAVVLSGFIIGYLDQIAKILKFKSGFNLADKELCQWKNFTLLSIRGMLYLSPAALYSSLFLDSHTLWLGVLAGLTFIPCYLIGYKLTKAGSQIGEFLLFCFISASILAGQLW